MCKSYSNDFHSPYTKACHSHTKILNNKHCLFLCNAWNSMRRSINVSVLELCVRGIATQTCHVLQSLDLKRNKVMPGDRGIKIEPTFKWSKMYSRVRFEKNKTCNVRVTEHWGAYTKPLLLWNNNKYYIFLCACVWVGALARTCACARVGFLIQYATRRRRIVCVLSGSTIFFDIIT